MSTNMTPETVQATVKKLIEGGSSAIFEGLRNGIKRKLCTSKKYTPGEEVVCVVSDFVPGAGKGQVSNARSGKQRYYFIASYRQGYSDPQIDTWPDGTVVRYPGHSGNGMYRLLRDDGALVSNANIRKVGEV